MEQQNLRDHLEALHRELSQAPDLDERGQRLLADVRSDLTRFDAATPSASGGDTAAAPLSVEERNQMQSRWQSAVVDFEGSHPQLARGLERMAVIISNFGL